MITFKFRNPFRKRWTVGAWVPMASDVERLEPIPAAQKFWLRSSATLRAATLEGMFHDDETGVPPGSLRVVRLP